MGAGAYGTPDDVMEYKRWSQYDHEHDLAELYVIELNIVITQLYVLVQPILIGLLSK